ncbi:hypothetical protein GCK32_016665 [Trichostrongylus colubriformis]|uniref:Secreted protein n=1 Tax=Trichostrongylus colubriformis TaxID=6319 RepID=A0AAN8FYR7_TRICO
MMLRYLIIVLVLIAATSEACGRRRHYYCNPYCRRIRGATEDVDVSNDSDEYRVKAIATRDISPQEQMKNNSAEEHSPQ